MCIEKCNVSFNSTYNNWNNIRKLLLESCIEYMKICQNDISFQNINLSNITNEFSNIKYESNDNESENNYNENNYKLIKVLFKNYDVLQLLKIEGIYHLLTKSDNNGMYTYTDSKLIFQMIEIIQYFIYNKTFLKDIEELKNMFSISYENKKDILIK